MELIAARNFSSFDVVVQCMIPMGAVPGDDGVAETGRIAL